MPAIISVTRGLPMTLRHLTWLLVAVIAYRLIEQGFMPLLYAAPIIAEALLILTIACSAALMISSWYSANNFLKKLKFIAITLIHPYWWIGIYLQDSGQLLLWSSVSYTALVAVYTGYILYQKHIK